MKNRRVAIAPDRELALLDLESAQLSDSGDYECLVSTPLDEARAHVRITVFRMFFHEIKQILRRKML
jgi:hypothetical protein